MHVFIIDTDSYAGNYERDLCAYMTGVVGEFEVDSKIADAIQPDLINFEWYADNVAGVSDDRGCYRPCQIEQTPDAVGQYLSTGINMAALPPATVVEELKRRAAGSFTSEYAAGDTVTITGFRFRTTITTVTETEVPL